MLLAADAASMPHVYYIGAALFIDTVARISRRLPYGDYWRAHDEARCNLI